MTVQSPSTVKNDIWCIRASQLQKPAPPPKKKTVFMGLYTYEGILFGVFKLRSAQKADGVLFTWARNKYVNSQLLNNTRIWYNHRPHWFPPPPPTALPTSKVKETLLCIRRCLKDDLWQHSRRMVGRFCRRHCTSESHWWGTCPLHPSPGPEFRLISSNDLNLYCKKN